MHSTSLEKWNESTSHAVLIRLQMNMLLLLFAPLVTAHVALALGNQPCINLDDRSV